MGLCEWDVLVVWVNMFFNAFFGALAGLCEGSIAS